MSTVHNEIRKGWLSEAVNRALGRTRDGGVERVSETLDIVMNPWGMPEWAYLRGEILGAAALFVGAIAAEYGYAVLHNPPGSGRIITVEAAGITNNAGTGQLVLLAEADYLLLGLTPTLGYYRDPRNTVYPHAIINRIFVGTHTVQLGSYLDHTLWAAGPTAYFMAGVPCILPPGFSIAVRNGSVNIAQLAILSWRERNAYPGELV